MNDSPEIRRALLEWFRAKRRTLPWRVDRHPYRIWVSEIMLQQTRVETVLSYFERFLERFPTVETLAEADVDQVLALWSGLGYYRRARLLHRAAQLVNDRGVFPDTVEEWRKLPGIGAYTSAAIASQTSGVHALAIDGNVERVLTRVLGYDENPKTASGRRFLTRAGLELVDRECPGDSNEALMELGATVCRLRAPLCDECPASGVCEARKSDRVESYPIAKPTARRRKRQLMAVVVRREQRVLLFRRKETEGVLAGTWELPWISLPESSLSDKLAERYGGQWTVGECLRTVRHSITFRDLVVAVHEGQATYPPMEVNEGREARWVDSQDLTSIPHSSLVGKALGGIGETRSHS